MLCFLEFSSAAEGMTGSAVCGHDLPYFLGSPYELSYVGTSYLRRMAVRSDVGHEWVDGENFVYRLRLLRRLLHQW
jgi:hypothetical protein